MKSAVVGEVMDHDRYADDADRLPVGNGSFDIDQGQFVNSDVKAHPPHFDTQNHGRMTPVARRSAKALS